jgi:hypothetical protein
MDLDKQLLNKLEKNELKCSVCKLIIPFTFKKGDGYTVPSFTLVDDKPVCYSDYHPKEFSLIQKKRKK